MEKKSPEKSRTSMQIKVANVFGLMVLALAFFTFPLTTFARSNENHLGIPGLSNKSRLQKLSQVCQNNGNDSSDSDNGCNVQAFQQVLKLLKGISTNIGNDSSDSSDASDSNSPLQQLLKLLKGISANTGNDSSDSSDASDSNSPLQQLLKLLNKICANIGKNNCGSTNLDNSSKIGNITRTSNTAEQYPFKIVGRFEQSGQPLGSKGIPRQGRNNSKITIVKVKNLKDVQQGLFFMGKDPKGDTFVGEVISPNQSPIKQAMGLINGQGKPQIVTLTL